VIDLAGTLVDSLKPIRFVSPFDHYGTPVAHDISLTSAGLMALTALLLAGLAVVLFERHDVRG
jgi:hypothetical protein